MHTSAKAIPPCSMVHITLKPQNPSCQHSTHHAPPLHLHLRLSAILAPHSHSRESLPSPPKAYHLLKKSHHVIPLLPTEATAIARWIEKKNLDVRFVSDTVKDPHQVSHPNIASAKQPPTYPSLDLNDLVPGFNNITADEKLKAILIVKETLNTERISPNSVLTQEQYDFYMRGLEMREKAMREKEIRENEIREKEIREKEIRDKEIRDTLGRRNKSSSSAGWGPAIVWEMFCQSVVWVFRGIWEGINFIFGSLVHLFLG